MTGTQIQMQEKGHNQLDEKMDQKLQLEEYRWLNDSIDDAIDLRTTYIPLCLRVFTAQTKHHA